MRSFDFSNGPDNCGSKKKKKKKKNEEVVVATFYGSIKLMLKKIILFGFKFFIKGLDCLFVKIVFYKYSVKCHCSASKLAHS